MVMPDHSDRNSTDTIHICSSDPFPYLDAGIETSSTIKEVSWTFNGNVISYKSGVQTTETGVYNFVATGDYIHLTKTVVIDIPVKYPCETIIPNVFTPNGDGHNDLFTIANLEHYPNSSLTVYARRGRKIYENTNYRNDWDGGTAEDGMYFYVLLRSDGKEFKGTVTKLH